jgi:prepilin-type N-terminal cleavage/methylation domain-containing protein
MNKGLTLIEVLVVTGLTAILVTLGASIFLSNNLFYEFQGGKIEINNSAREAADKIDEFGREAIAVEASHTYLSTTHTTDADTMVFRLPALDAQNDIIEDIFDYVVVTASSTVPERLELYVDADPLSARPERELLLSDNLADFNIVYDDPDPALARVITFDLTLTGTGRNPASDTVYGRVTLRN